MQIASKILGPLLLYHILCLGFHCYDLWDYTIDDGKINLPKDSCNRNLLIMGDKNVEEEDFKLQQNKQWDFEPKIGKGNTFWLVTQRSLNFAWRNQLKSLQIMDKIYSLVTGENAPTWSNMSVSPETQSLSPPIKKEDIATDKKKILNMDEDSDRLYTVCSIFFLRFCGCDFCFMIF